jgi:hypothetical protein
MSSYIRCPQCTFTVRASLVANGGYCPRCLIREKTAIVLEPIPVELFRGSDSHQPSDRRKDAP